MIFRTIPAMWATNSEVIPHDRHQLFKEDLGLDYRHPKKALPGINPNTAIAP
jgi:hypothetical protein